ncbi:MAG: SDR family NAD(P)-dependent oxidoreductase [Bacteroidota bacterium]
MNILITGTSSGLGYGLAKRYLDQGNVVYGISRKNNEVLDAFSDFRFLSMDLNFFSSIETNIPLFLDGVSSLDLVILNAGILNEIKDLKDTSLDEIKRVMDVNVWSNKILIDALFRLSIPIRQIVAISSGASVSGSRGWNAYALSKATLNMLIELYSKEKTDTHFTSLAPGLIDSNMQDYIYSLGEEEKFPVLKKLRSAKGTDAMPGPEEASIVISKGIKKAKTFKSGEFIDVRKI